MKKRGASDIVKREKRIARAEERKLANRLLVAITTNGAGEGAQRIALMRRMKDGSERDIGGWGLDPLRAKILATIREGKVF